MVEELKILWLLPVLVCIGWSIYNYIQLFKHRNELFLKKRSLFLVFGYTTSLLISMINILLTITANLYVDQSSVPRLVGYGLSMITTYLYLYFLNVKTWMIYFQYQWTKNALQLKWQMIINTNYLIDAANTSDKTEINWFIRNRNKYGNLSFVQKSFGLIHLLFAIICCICVTVFLPSDPALRIVGISLLAVITLFTVVFYIVIIYKTPPFNDIYYIHAENKLIAPVLIIGLIIYVIFWGVEAFIYYTAKNEDLGGTLANVSQIEILLMWTVLLYISTTRIINKNTKRKDKNIKNVPSNSNPQLQRNIISNKLDKFDLENVVTTEETIDQFMKYLSREFSMELLLSFIEFTNFQQLLKDKYKVDKSLTEDKEYRLLSFPSNVPTSSIVKNQWALSICDPLHDPKTKAYKLYNKYVKTGAEFEINVSYATRKKCQQMLENFSYLLECENIQADDLFKIFHECKKQVIGLLNNSLTRFKNTTDHVHAPTNAQISVHVRDLSTQTIQTNMK